MPHKPLFYPPCSIICHGLCEVRIAEHLRLKTRRGIGVFSNNGGRSPLEVQNLPLQLPRIPGLRNREDFARFYHLEKRELADFFKGHRLFILMDKDAADEQTWFAYKNGSLLSSLWFGSNTTPIYFEPDFDDVSKRAGHKIDKKAHKPDQVYKFLNNQKFDYLEDLSQVKSHTNLEALLSYLKQLNLL